MHYFNIGAQGTTLKLDEDSEDGSIECNVPLDLLEVCDFEVIYAHPEAMKKSQFARLMRSEVYQSKICAVVIDEVHMVSEWYLFHLLNLNVLYTHNRDPDQRTTADLDLHSLQ